MEKVKICGITNLEDALFACEAGADALGFVFYEKSPRYIRPKLAKEIALKLPPFVKKVGLFVNETPKFINEVMVKACMDIAQLHFEVSKDFLSQLECDYLEVKRVKSKKDIADISYDRYCLVDAYVKSYGGEGKRIHQEWFEGVDCSKFILAGGLDEKNVQEMKKYGFYGFDVSSGVEKTKGLKNHTKIKNFIKAVKYDN
jgi:phosphoribosylanthranilate isomerase